MPKVLIPIDGQKLRHARETKGLTVEELGALSGVPWKSIENYERGINLSTSVDRLEQLARALKLRPHRLKGDTRRASNPATSQPQLRPEVAQQTTQEIPGKRLFEHHGYYPVDLSGNNVPVLDREVFVKAINYLLDDTNDRLAAMDLVYLREDNLDDTDEQSDALFSPHKQVYDGNFRLYAKLIDKYGLSDFIKQLAITDESIFRNYKRIVNDLGDTLKDVCFEIVLHNVRNPLRSVIAARNTEMISGRKGGDPSTRLVVQYVKHQGKHLKRAIEDKKRSLVSYTKPLQPTKHVKATTIPIYHPRYGLIGIICINIDIDTAEALDEPGRKKFIENYVHNSGHTPDFEREWI